MTLEEAIEFQEQYLRQSQTHIADCLDAAIKLGIEALKRIKEGRGGYTKEIVSSLPGETEGVKHDS